MTQLLGETLKAADDFVWGPCMLVLLVGTGIFLTIRTGALAWKNLGYAIRKTLSREARQKGEGAGDVSPFLALTTALAATIGTGNIVGVATAMVSGGPGALVWMWISAAFGLTSKFAECFLAVKYREVNRRGEMTGGPMYVMKKALPNQRFGAALGWLFALFAVIASFGIGNLTQANSIASSLKSTFQVSPILTGTVLAILTVVILVGGIQAISKVSGFVVPLMAVFYVAAGLVVILGNIQNVPQGLVMIFQMAFSPRAVSGGLAGTITASMLQAVRYGVARGVFSNEAGMGSAAISACAASTDHPVAQAYINMTGTFWDTLVVCSITGLCIASSGVLGSVDASGEYVTGAALTILAFQSVMGETGGVMVSIAITLFAFSTILGWEYQGEKAFEYLTGGTRFQMLYRVAFSLVVYVGAVTSLELVWNFSDIANALMAVPNLICMLLLSKEVARDMKAYERVILSEKNAGKRKKHGKG